MQILQYNAKICGGTVFLRDAHTHQREKGEVTLNRIKLIERHGVHVFDMDKLPETVEKSEYLWKYELSVIREGRNQRLLNII